ncbi:hypothetical protein ACG10_05695 [Azotobacter chroococcum]|nr:hypothetical protein ACG10_05695 [Azotobacter chroococcum]
MGAGVLTHTVQQCSVEQGSIAGQYQQPCVVGNCQSGANAGQGAREVRTVVMHHTVGIGCITFGIAVAGDDQVIGEWSGQGMQVGDQRLASPFQQPLVAPSHALPATASQQQYRTGGQGRTGEAHRMAPVMACGITPARLLHNPGRQHESQG